MLNEPELFIEQHREKLICLDETDQTSSWQKTWSRGGFPDSLLADDDEASSDWRNDFIQTFLERDIP